jgi:hypothetical protein
MNVGQITSGSELTEQSVARFCNSLDVCRSPSLVALLDRTTAKGAFLNSALCENS